jgi:DNA-3-methyladenine glycosylase I
VVERRGLPLPRGEGEAFPYVPRINRWTHPSQVPATTPESDRMSKTLRKAGFRFVGSTICYAFMQATGMVDDHLTTCFCHRP